MFHLLYAYATISFMLLFGWWVPNDWLLGDKLVPWLVAAALIPPIAVGGLVWWWWRTLLVQIG